MPSQRLLAILTRNPELGKVKTRLACTIGDNAALHVYELLRYRTAEVAQAVAATRMVLYSHFIPATDCFLPTHCHYRLQEGCDFGERMHHAFISGFNEGFHAVVLIGSDCYDITPTIVEQAFQQLEDSDVVLGPAKDGGFYLIGMKTSMPPLFKDRTWSTSTVLHETICLLQEAKASYNLLEELADIDTLEDLQHSSLWLTSELATLRSTFADPSFKQDCV